MIFKNTTRFDTTFDKWISALPRESAVNLAKIVEQEFHRLLHDVPQYTGNYCANMTAQAGLGAGARGGEKVFPDKEELDKQDKDAPFIRGNMPAINRAKQNNQNLIQNMTGHITKKAGWATGVTIYNRMDYADKVESLNWIELREPNRGGVHALKKFSVRLAARLKAGELLSHV